MKTVLRKFLKKDSLEFFHHSLSEIYGPWGFQNGMALVYYIPQYKIRLFSDLGQGWGVSWARVKSDPPPFGIRAASGHVKQDGCAEAGQPVHLKEMKLRKTIPKTKLNSLDLNRCKSSATRTAFLCCSWVKFAYSLEHWDFVSYLTANSISYHAVMNFI